MKLKRLVAGVAMASFMGVGVFSSSQQINAATWHKGTPKIIRGTWKMDGHKHTRWIIGKSEMSLFSPESSWGKPFSHLRYRKYNRYTFKLFWHDNDGGINMVSYWRHIDSHEEAYSFHASFKNPIVLYKGDYL
ncbi:MAG: hypothetical protein LKF37_10055 [Lentilactobacillus diolivorans]|jgi:hypothetical protein|nr:hypothetical protein [Lentilactobacillus diolivorans]